MRLYRDWVIGVAATAIVAGLAVSSTVDAQAESVTVRRRIPEKSLVPRYGEKTDTQMNSQITLSLSNVSLDEALRTIAKVGNVGVLYRKADLPQKRVSMKAVNLRVDDAFARILDGTGLKAVIGSDGQVLVTAQARETKVQQGTGVIGGKIVDSVTGKGVSGATISIQGAKINVVSSLDGNYELRGVPSGEHVLSVKLFGMIPMSRSITVRDGEKVTINFMMKPTATQLSGVVTTATGVQRKVEVGNDITVIDVEDIIQKNPVSSVTDLLATRVPGVIVAQASGEPGAKREVRIRGTNSIRASNEPIYIIDGIQVISDRAGADTTGFKTSPIDQLDVNAISKIEVLKGPSAVALYGSNAANGVIIITTKRGQEGPARWSTVAKLSQETMPGKWPVNYFAWGQDLVTGTGTVQCPRYATKAWAVGKGDLPLNWGAFPNCRYDSTTVYQILNDPQTTVFGKGIGKDLSMTVSGGVRQFTYSLTGGFSSILGLLKMPDADVGLLADAGIDLTSWQRRPQALDKYNGTATFGIGIGNKSSVQYTTMFTRQDKRSTPLIGILNKANRLDPPIPLYDGDGVRIGVGSGISVAEPNFMAGQNFNELRFTNSARYQATAWNTLTFEATGGIDVASGRETYLRKTGDYCPLSGPINVAFGKCPPADGNDYTAYRSSAIATDFHMRLSGTAKGYRWLNIRPVVGVDMNGITNGQSGVGAVGLPVGGRGIRGAQEVKVLADAQGARRTAGVLAQATVAIADRFYLPFSVRTDAGNAIGRQSKPIFPRTALSYVASDEPMFRSIPLLGRLPELRLRTAFGVAGQQPGLTEKHRTFTFSSFPIDNINTAIASINSVGNTKLSPEISRELELGFDATVIETPRSRLAATFTLARKHTTDLLATENLPPSLGGISGSFGGLASFGTASRISNIGDAVNNSFEISIDGFRQIGFLDWTTTNGFTAQNGKLVRMNNSFVAAPPGQAGKDKIDTYVRNIVGYALNGIWGYPVLGYNDEDGNGLIDLKEVFYSDSLRYVGPSSPRFMLTSNNQFTVASRLTVSATMMYEDGAITKTKSDRNNDHSQVLNDPTLSIVEQVRLLYDGYASAYRVSTLRFQSLQITYNIPVRIAARYFRTQSVQVAVSGTNLGLWSTFSGMDPNVGGILRRQENATLPIPRTYGLSVRIQ